MSSLKPQSKIVENILGFDATSERVVADTVENHIKNSVTGKVCRWIASERGNELQFDKVFVYRDDVQIKTFSSSPDYTPLEVEVDPATIKRVRNE